MTQSVDLPAYFHRIAYTGDPAPALDTLRVLHLRHATAIPFENLDPLLNRPVRLDLLSLERKLVHERRGGYCYEHNLLFRHVLEALGFKVTGLAARVLWNVPEGVVTPRAHMLLRVDLDGEVYLADVGFGGLTQTAPLRLEADVEQATSLEPFRLVRAGDEFVLQALLRGVWKPLYRFGLQEQHLPDYEVANWYVSTHPASLFVNGLMAARPDHDRRYALWNNELSVHHSGGITQRCRLETPGEFRETLERDFGIRLPADPSLDGALSRLIAGPAVA